MDPDTLKMIGAIIGAVIVGGIIISLIVAILPFLLGIAAVLFIWRIIFAFIKTGNPIDWR